MNRVNAAMFSRSELVALKRKALRRGVWFRVLSRIDRATIDLAIRCVQRVRSATLVRVIVGIAKKIEDSVTGFLIKAEAIGRLLAERVAELAVSWRNMEASDWKDDALFIRYLGAMSLSK